MTDAAPAPRAHRDPAVLAAKRARLREPHVAPLNDLAARIAEESGEVVPWFDPADGGIRARVLLLLEAPGRGAARVVEGPGGSGLVSQDNDDPTAATLFDLLRDAGLDRSEVVVWNVVPWYVGTAERIRAVGPRDVAAAASHLASLLGLLPDLRVVVPMGRPALEGWMRALRTAPRLLPTLASGHPSPRSLHARPGARDGILAVLVRAAREIGRPSLEP